MAGFIGSNIYVGNVIAPAVAGGGGGGYLLDTYPAFAAYSVRQLSSTATNCIRIRRASDDAEQDIGFSNGWVNTAAIIDFCGASIGYVVTWYDQSGFSRDAVQSTSNRQVRIYDGSAIEEEGSKPTLNSFGQDEYFATTIDGLDQPYSVFSVGRSDSGKTNQRIHAATASYINFTTGTTTINAGTTLSTGTDDRGTRWLTTALFNTTSSKLRLNGVQKASGTVGVGSIITPIYLLADSAGFGPWGGNTQEYIFFDSDQSANISAIESDMNSAFGVY